MSKIDERIVEMSFENEKFEKNIGTSSKSLSSFDSQLEKTGKTSGLTSLGGVVEGITGKFSALGTIGVGALLEIGKRATDLGVNLAKSIAIDPILQGYSEYELKINSIKTMLASGKTKEGLPVTLAQVNEQLDELNSYADKTIYSFADMTQNIGKFTNAGVDLKTSVAAIKGISNEAALSGANAEEASRAMYNFAQALSAGYVKLIDWKSIENANMATVEFKQYLLDAAVAAGTVTKTTDGMYKVLTKNGQGRVMDDTISATKNFNDSLAYQWMTTSVLTDTLSDYADETTEIGKKATEAATKVRTFSQLMDTTKEAVGSGWTETFELLFGNYDQATEVWTGLSNVIGDFVQKNSDARNQILKDWAALGGRNDAIESLKNIWEGLGSVFQPIQKAFSEVFPPMTGKKLAEITKQFKEFTETLKLTPEAAKDVQNAFKGIFSLFSLIGNAFKTVATFGYDIGKQIFPTISSGALSAAGKIGEFLTNINNVINSGKSFQVTTDIFKNFFKYLDSISLDSINFNGFFDVLNNLVAGGIGLGIIKFLKSITGISDEFTDVFSAFKKPMENVTGILGGVKDTMKAYQDQLKAGTLIKIATAIGILSASIFVISTIDEDKLNSSLAGMTMMFTNLLAAMAIFSKIGINIKGSVQASTLMIGMATSILILSTALAQLGSLEWEEIGKGLTGVGVLMAQLLLFVNNAKISPKTTSFALGMIGLAAAIKILGSACEDFGNMKWEEITKGLTGVGILLGELAIFTNVTGNAKHVISTGIALAAIGASMKIFASALKDIATMSWTDIAKGLTGLSISLAAVALAVNVMPKNMIAIGAGLTLTASALLIMSNALKSFGSMDWDEIEKGLVALGGSIGILAIGLNAMNGTTTGSASILVAATSLAILVPSLKALGSMEWEDIGKGLIAIAGAFAVIGLAGLALTPAIPSILSLGAAFALIGVGVLAIGAGLFAAGAGIASLVVGLTALAGVTTVGAASIIAALSIITIGIAELIPTIAKKLAEGVIEFAKTIADGSPFIGEAFKAIFVDSLIAINDYAPQIVDLVFQFFISVLNGVAKNLPALIQAGFNVIGAFFTGLIDALKGIDTNILIKSIAGVGFLSALLLAFGAIASLVPGAMVGVLGAGAVLSEIALVLAAVGAFAQIPGLKWFISEGGELLQGIGEALGKFIGGFVGGIAVGVTDSLPRVGSNLSLFMANAMPFINGAKQIDSNLITSVQALADTVIILTKANILDGLTAWLTGGSSLVSFGKELAAFAPYFVQYASLMKNIDAQVVLASSNAAKVLSEMAKNLPDQGGIISWFTGDNTLSMFGRELEKFGPSLMAYAASVAGMSPDVVTNSTNAAKALAELANNLPNSGGLVSWFTGDNDLAGFGRQLVTFGQSLSAYYESIKGITASGMSGANSAFKDLIDIAKGVKEIDGKSMESFASNLAQTGRLGLDGFTGAFTNASQKVSAAANGMVDTFTTAVKNKTVSFSTTFTTLIQSGITAIVNKRSSFTTEGTLLVTNLVNGVKLQESPLKSSFSLMLTNTITAISAIFPEFYNTGKSLVTNLTNGVSGYQANNLSQAFTALLSQSLSAIRLEYSSFYTAGKYLVEGFANGISKNTFMAEAKAKAMAKAAAKAAKKELDEHSPSKVGYGIGDYFGIAFVNGISDNIQKAWNASTDMASSAKEGLTTSISKITDALNGEINSQPVITPILDLSNVQANASRLNAMLDTSRMAEVASGIEANRISQNGQNGRASSDGVNIEFNQYNTSPKALSRIDLYRQTNNQLAAAKGLVTNS